MCMFRVEYHPGIGCHVGLETFRVEAGRQIQMSELVTRILGRGPSKYKSPEVGVHLVGSDKREEASGGGSG